MNQATVLAVGAIAVSAAAFFVPNAQVPRPELRVSAPIVSYPWTLGGAYSDKTVNALVNVTFSGNTSATSPTVSVSPVHPSTHAEGLEVVVERLQTIRMLSNGWLGEGSSAPDHHLLEWLDANAHLLALSTSAISIIPLGDGGVSLEWRTEAVEFTVELQPDDQMVFVADNTQTDELEESVQALDAASLAEFISHGTQA